MLALGNKLQLFGMVAILCLPENLIVATKPDSACSQGTKEAVFDSFFQDSS